jgi:uncharacterized protein YbbC (DUF1343 family)
MKKKLFILLLGALTACQSLGALSNHSSQKVMPGIDVFLNEDYLSILKGKKIALLTNHTAVNSRMQSTIDLFKANAKAGGYTLAALFAPEHGLTGSLYADESFQEECDSDGIPIYSLHGKTQRPTSEMLKDLDVIVYDIQDIGSRSYTYVSTLFYTMEEAAKKKITVVVLDRPNPLGGSTVDGPMLDEQWRSIVGYVNVPYCHGMTVGELARFFNGEYKIGCKLVVVPMKGWSRRLTFQETGLPWIPTSPYIPEATTAFYYPTTGILGELSLVNIGIGYTLPFKIIGAPWIEAKTFAQALNAQRFPGVHFEPFYYRPFYGKFAKRDCQGVLIVITDQKVYQPVTTQFLLIGILKGLYPKQFEEAIETAKSRQDRFCRVVGTEEVYRLITTEKNIVWKLKALHLNERRQFLALRKKYLLTNYADE